VRYNGYYCNIEIVVPSQYVLPTLIFNAVGSNVSYIRAGPLDPDVSNFTDFSFGPNSLEMYGKNLEATFVGIQAVKYVIYQVDNGLLSMADVYFVDAKLNSTFASIIVSTPLACDSKYLQKSRNDVCLASYQSSIAPECARRSFFPTLVLNPPDNCPIGLDCSDPETYFNQLCVISPDCVKMAGECDDQGRCTATECTGLYQGRLVNQPGALFKKPVSIVMSSTFGILSLSCLEPAVPLSSAVVNKKVEGDDIDMQPEDHAALDESFHPGGGVRPKQDWWNLFITGAGAVDSSQGVFVWLSNARYLVLQPALLDVISLGLLSPDVGKSQSNLQPGFCLRFLPAVTIKQGASLRCTSCCSGNLS